MKELTIIPAVRLDSYDVEVNTLLTVVQIQQIVNAVKMFDTWAEREQNKNILAIYHATNLSIEDLEQYPYETLEQSGLVEAVIGQIRNFHKIDEALEWTESEKRAMAQILKEAKPMFDAFKEKVGKRGKTSKK